MSIRSSTPASRCPSSGAALAARPRIFARVGELRAEGCDDRRVGRARQPAGARPGHIVEGGALACLKSWRRPEHQPFGFMPERERVMRSSASRSCCSPIARHSALVLQIRSLRTSEPCDLQTAAPRHWDHADQVGRRRCRRFGLNGNYGERNREQRDREKKWYFYIILASAIHGEPAREDATRHGQQAAYRHQKSDDILSRTAQANGSIRPATGHLMPPKRSHNARLSHFDNPHCSMQSIQSWNEMARDFGTFLQW